MEINKFNEQPNGSLKTNPTFQGEMFEGLLHLLPKLQLGSGPNKGIPIAIGL